MEQQQYLNGVNNANAGTVIVKSGTISSTNYSGVTNSATGTLIIGTEGGTVNATNPDITGKQSGVNNSGRMEFYDGIIKGPTNCAIVGAVTKIETGYEVIKTTKDNIESAVVDVRASVKILSTGNEYGTLKSAIAACGTSEETIQVIRDITIPVSETTIAVPSTANIKLDLNGYKVKAENSNTITNNGNFEILSSAREQVLNESEEIISAAEEGSGILEGVVGNIITNNEGATLKLDKFVVNNTASGTAEEQLKVFDNKGTIQVNNTRITCGGTYVTAIGNSENATAKVLSGTIILNRYNFTTTCIDNSGNGYLEIIDGSLVAGYEIKNASSGKAQEINGENVNVSMKISGGQMECINESGLGEIIITGGTITSFDALTSGKVTVDGGTVFINTSIELGKTGTKNITIKSGNVTGLINGNNGNVSITGGTVSSIDNTAGGIVNITEGTIGGIKNATGSLTITGGTVTGTEYGIYNTANGTVTIGEDSRLITTTPTISGSTAGICNANGTLNFYDGKISGPEWIKGSVSNIPEGANIIIEKVGTTENATLGTDTAIAQIVGGTIEDSIQAAIAKCTTGPATIKLLKNAIIGSSANKLVINNTQDIILDLNGFELESYSDDYGIQNNGILKITDSSVGETGQIVGHSTAALSIGTIKNTGTLTIEKGTVTNEITSADGTNTGTNTIYNTQSGNVIVTGGIVTSTQTSDIEKNEVRNICSQSVIYNDGKGQIKLLGGSIISGCNDQNKYIINNANNDFENATYIEINGAMIGGTGVAVQAGTAIYNTGAASVNFKSGKIQTVYDSIVSTNGDMSFTMENGTEIISRTSHGIFIGTETGYTEQRTSSITINGGSISCGFSGKRGGNAIGTKGTTNGTTIVINGGTIGSTYNVASINAICSDVEINGGAFAKIVNAFNGNMIIKGGDMKTVQSVANDGQEYNLDITGGIITGELAIVTNKVGAGEFGKIDANIQNVTITNPAGNGITMSGEGSTLTLGVKDYPVSTTAPAITGSKKGIEITGGTFNFYDGIITGTTGALVGTPADMPTLFDVNVSQDGTVAKLAVIATFEKVVTVNSMYYDTLQEAINAATTGSTIRIEKNIILSSSVTIPEDKNITIDLNSYIISSAATDATIINNGTLTIIDSSEEGTPRVEYGAVYNYYGPAIENNGTLTIGVNDANEYVNSPRIVGITNAITGEGILNQYDGEIINN